MKAYTILFFLLILVLNSPPFYSQSRANSNDLRTAPVAELIRDFTSESWLHKVAPAKEELESRQGTIIPDLIKLLDDGRKVKLRNTADLIYPGAETFYGHGWIVDYDVDVISVRAGWLLEELTFQDFGFREGAISEDNLLRAAISGKRDVSLSSVTGPEKELELRVKIRNIAVERAKDWWSKTKGPWKRFAAILVGLRSTDTALQHRIFQWLRNGRTACEGLTVSSFERYILPEVKRLRKSTSKDIRNEAEMTLESHQNEKWWLRYKLMRDHPDDYSSMELK